MLALDLAGGNLASEVLGRQKVDADADREVAGGQQGQDSGEEITEIESVCKHVCCLRCRIVIVNRRSLNTRILVHMIAGVKQGF